MLANLFSSSNEFWEWLRANDLPNWVATAFSLVVWPIALLIWHRRRVNSVAGLEVHFFQGHITIAGKAFPAIDVRFTNHTGSVVYVSGVRVRNCSTAFPVPMEAARDVSSDSYHLKFNRGGGAFEQREVTLQTNETAQTCMPVVVTPSDQFFRHIQPWYLRLFGLRKYFVLEYTALMGNTRFLVATRY